MNKWQIKLINIGRNKVCKIFDVTAETLPIAERIATLKCKKYLASKNVELEHSENLKYEVFAGFRSIGIVIITSR